MSPGENRERLYVRTCSEVERTGDFFHPIASHCSCKVLIMSDLLKLPLLLGTSESTQSQLVFL